MVLESSAMTKTVVETMAAGSKAMKNVHSEMYVCTKFATSEMICHDYCNASHIRDIDQVEDLREDIQDSMADVGCYASF